MNYFDAPPLELLHEIAGNSEAAYRAMLAYPRFARAVTLVQRIDYRIAFGHDVRVEKRSISWYRHDILHRKDGPAVIYCAGYIESQEDGPAIIKYIDNECWYYNGKLHRDGGPAIVNKNIGKYWYQYGKQHREDGPASIRDGIFEEWYQDDVLHREDGPAIICEQFSEWYVKGKFIRRELSSSYDLPTKISL